MSRPAGATGEKTMSCQHLPASHYARCAGRELHYVEWGRRDAPPLVMWHGLARTGRDFDDLAQALADRYRIICPDTIGRGLSQWSPGRRRITAWISMPRWCASCSTGWACPGCAGSGTSMGGAIGMHGAATALRGRITHLVLNDIGPTLPAPAIERILAYAGAPPAFDTVGELEA